MNVLVNCRGQEYIVPIKTYSMAISIELKTLPSDTTQTIQLSYCKTYNV